MIFNDNNEAIVSGGWFEKTIHGEYFQSGDMIKVIAEDEVFEGSYDGKKLIFEINCDF
jgi:hypothetical protein